jgi:hypothetical protein
MLHSMTVPLIMILTITLLQNHHQLMWQCDAASPPTSINIGVLTQNTLGGQRVIACVQVFPYFYLTVVSVELMLCLSSPPLPSL